MNHCDVVNGSVTDCTDKVSKRQILGSKFTGSASIRIQNSCSTNIDCARMRTAAAVLLSHHTLCQHLHRARSTTAPAATCGPYPERVLIRRRTRPARQNRLYTFPYSILKQLHYESEWRVKRTSDISRTSLASIARLTYAGSQYEGERPI